MEDWSFYLVIGMTTTALALLGLDALWWARAAWRRRRRAQGGVYGVVLDVHGNVLGTYVDPLQEPHRSTRVHGPGSVWTAGDPTAWAWEGRAETEEEALHLASRLRSRHVRLVPELRESLRLAGGEGSTGRPPAS